MKKLIPNCLKTAIPCLLLGALAPVASAESGWYVGASVGNSKVGMQEIKNADIDIDDSDTGYKFYTGLKFTILAVEGGYIDFGTIEDAEGSAEISGFDAFGVLSMGLGPVEVFGKLGGFVWDADVDTVADTYKDDGFDPAIGVGAAFTLGGIGIRAEYEYFDIGDFDDVSMLSLGATFWIF